MPLHFHAQNLQTPRFSGVQRAKDREARTEFHWEGIKYIATGQDANRIQTLEARIPPARSLAWEFPESQEAIRELTELKRQLAKRAGHQPRQWVQDEFPPYGHWKDR